MKATQLCELFFKYRSDKCPSIGHSYSPVYYDFFKEIQEDAKFILEIGVGSHKIMDPLCGEDYAVGASLFAWRDFFKNSQVFGLDSDDSTIFEADRIKCFFSDQSNSNSLEKSIENIKNHLNLQKIEFDLILDDGSHIVDHMLLTFETLGKYVKTGGFYVIEDIQDHNLDTFIKFKVKDFSIVKIHSGENNDPWDNVIIYKKIHNDEN